MKEKLTAGRANKRRAIFELPAGMTGRQLAELKKLYPEQYKAMKVKIKKRFRFLLLLLLLIVPACNKRPVCYECNKHILYDWFYLPDKDTLFASDTVFNYCGDNVRLFERQNTDTVVVFYIYPDGSISRLWGFQFINTGCNPTD